MGTKSKARRGPRLYLRLQHQTWSARFRVPEDVRGHPPFGKAAELYRSLNTKSQAAATLLAYPIIAEWQAAVDAIRGLPGSEWRSPRIDPAKAHELAQTVEGAAVEPTLALARKRTAPVLIDAFVERRRREVEARTAAMEEADVRLFISEFPDVSLVTRTAVAKWLTKLTTEGAKPLTVATARRKLSAIRRYWSWLQDQGDISKDAPSPFDKPTFDRVAVKASGMKGGWLPFSAEDVCKLHQAAKADNDPELASLITLAAYTGARLEEICALKVEHIGAAITITEAKTEAGVREVPIHSKLGPILKGLTKGKGGSAYLLADLGATKYGDRSGAIGKRFGRLKRALGYGERQVFHSIRKCVVTQLDRAGVVESLVAELVGHERPNFTFRRYSGGTTMEQKRKAIEKVRYPTALR